VVDFLSSWDYQIFPGFLRIPLLVFFKIEISFEILKKNISAFFYKDFFETPMISLCLSGKMIRKDKN